jgi:hypothetical protein
VQRAAVVDREVGERVRDRRHHRHLRREVHDALDAAVLRGDRRERGEDAVRDIAGHDLECGVGAGERLGEPAL